MITPVSPVAALDSYARRVHTESEHVFRTSFQRDRDRILYSKEFRRLSGKTQVFVAGFDDHVRTRLTHTLEVAQIANTVIRRLGLNEVLGEAISLGHDLGHTPFGHVGERTLNYIMNGCDGKGDFGCAFKKDSRGFKHNWQGIRTVQDLENINEVYNGLNLTDSVRWGILHHTKTQWRKCENRSQREGKCNLRHHSNKKCAAGNLELDYYTSRYKFPDPQCWSIEAIIVKYADEIAQRHHDVEDAVTARLLDKDELIHTFESCFKAHFSEADLSKIERIKDLKMRGHELYLPSFATLIINFLTTQLINETRRKIAGLQKRYSIHMREDFMAQKETIFKDNSEKWVDIVGYPKDIAEEERGGDAVFQRYLKERVLNSQIAQAMDSKSNYIVRQLFTAYMSSPQQLPNRTVSFVFKNYDIDVYNEITKTGKPLGAQFGVFRDKLKTLHNHTRDNKYKLALLRTICDYIAGMTDQYAIDQYELLYGKTHFS